MSISVNFETYKRLEPHKWVKFKEWRDVKEAWKIVSYSMEKYNEMMKQR
jgi:inorganic pyrophosphatase